MPALRGCAQTGARFIAAKQITHEVLFVALGIRRAEGREVEIEMSLLNSWLGECDLSGGVVKCGRRGFFPVSVICESFIDHVKDALFIYAAYNCNEAV
jgi:hypothetical protein